LNRDSRGCWDSTCVSGVYSIGDGSGVAGASSGASVGIVVGIVASVLVALGVVAFVVYRARRSSPVPKMALPSSSEYAWDENDLPSATTTTTTNV